MKKITQRDTAHPWNYFKVMKLKMSKMLKKLPNESLDDFLYQIHSVVPATRSEKIAVLMTEWDNNYREKFFELHNFTLESTKNPKAFRKQFRKFKLKIRIIQLLEFLKRLNPFIKHNKDNLVIVK